MPIFQIRPALTPFGLRVAPDKFPIQKKKRPNKNINIHCHRSKPYLLEHVSFSFPALPKVTALPQLTTPKAQDEGTSPGRDGGFCSIKAQSKCNLK